MTLLLAVNLLETVAIAITLWLRNNLSYSDDIDTFGFYAYGVCATIVEVIFQAALLVTLLFAPRKLK